MKKLYKYRPLDKEGFTLDSLRNNYLYFSSILDFNDPFDSIMKIKYEGEYFEFDEYFRKSNVLYESSQQKENAISTLKGIKWSINDKQQYLCDHRICCLTPQFDNILMWSHYADNHKGVCIEYDFDFNTDKNGISAFEIETTLDQFNNGRVKDVLIAMEVKYSEALPPPFNPICGNSSQLINFVLSKHKDWKYEKEYRIFSDISFLLQGAKVRLKKPIKKVIFGLMCTPDTIQKTIESLSNCKDLEFERMVEGSKDFELCRETINKA